RRGMGLARSPIEPVVERQGLTACDRRARYPIGDDIVVDLVVRRDFHELHRALAPLAQRLDPNAGTTVIKSAIILIVVEVAIALNEAEALRIGIVEGIGLHLRWIVERPPYALALARPKRQAVAVVDFGPPILATARIVLAVPEHAGERRDPQSLDRISREKIHVHGHNGALGTFGIDPIGAGNAGAIQQRVNGHGARTLRFAKPEFG